MRRLIIGTVAMIAAVLAGVNTLYLGLLQLLTFIVQFATQMNEYTTAMMAATMIFLLTRGPVMVRIAWSGINTSFKRMHMFYAGIALMFLSVTFISFVAGAGLFWNSLISLFSGTAPAGGAILQSVMFVFGAVFVIFDFPIGKITSRGRMM